MHRFPAAHFAALPYCLEYVYYLETPNRLIRDTVEGTYSVGNQATDKGFFFSLSLSLAGRN